MTTSQTTLRVDFVSESVGYENTFGWYNRVTGLGGILFADVEAEGKKAPLVAGQSSVTFTVNTADVGNIQFFLISDGYNLNKNDKDDFTGAIKVIQLSDGSWAVADVDANGNVRTKHGSPDLLQGAGANTLTLNNITVGSLSTADFIFGTPAPIVGDANANNLVGTSVNDTISGLGGNDTLQGLAGNDALDGGTGVDRAIYTDATGAISVDMAAGTVSGTGVGSDTLTSVEAIRGSGSADTYVATGWTGASVSGSTTADLQRVRRHGRQRHHHGQRRHGPVLLRTRPTS